MASRRLIRGLMGWVTGAWARAVESADITAASEVPGTETSTQRPSHLKLTASLLSMKRALWAQTTPGFIVRIVNVNHDTVSEVACHRPLSPTEGVGGLLSVDPELGGLISACIVPDRSVLCPTQVYSSSNSPVSLSNR